MKIFKALLPIIILISLLIYIREYYFMLPTSLTNALQYLPVLLIILTTTVAIYFNQIKVLLSVIILGLLYFSNTYHWINTEMKIVITASFIPILIIIASFFNKNPIVSVRSLPLYFTHIFIILLGFWLIEHQPIWATEYLYATWLPEKYFDWSPLHQLPLFIYCLSFIILIIFFSKKQSTKSASDIVLLIATFVLIQANQNLNDISLIVSSLLILYLFVLLQNSRHMAYIDELTLLPGRRALQEKMQSLLGVYTIAMVDIDFFKKFNDQYGHDIGDDVLRMIAAKLASVKGGGTAYRYGGEEFTIVFGNKSVEQTLDHLEELRENIALTKFVVNRRIKTNKNSKNNSVKITVSIGVSDSINVSSPEDVIKQADVALYKAKKKGRNCIS